MTQTTIPDAAALRAALMGHCGSETYHRVNHISPGFVVTEGVKHMAQLAQAFWFCDLVAAHAPAVAALDHFSSLTLEVSDQRTAQFTATDGNTRPKVYATQSIPYTDFPCGTWNFYLTHDGHHSVLMLPSEY